MSLYKTLKYSAWLGWEMDSNWTDPFLFTLYSIVRPIAGTFLVVLMYWFAKAPMDLFALMFVSSVFYMYIFNVLFGVSWVIHEDREHYKVLKYIYISPSNIYLYLLGRAFSKTVITTIAVVVTLAFGVALLGVRITLADPLLFLLSFILGLNGIAAFGIIMAGISLLMARHNFFIGESLAGLFYLFCGVIFPLSVLPPWGQMIGKILPMTYWLEATRRSLLGFGDPSLAGLSDLYIFLLLSAFALGFLLISFFSFGLCARVSKKRGILDMTTWY
jgi:ABC-2 type transport system permease protein